MEVQTGRGAQKESANGWLGKHKAGTLIIVVFSIVYFADVLVRASDKFFWYDELFTVYLCRLPSMHALWAALANGTDFNPPLFYLVTRASTRLLGEGNVGARLPEILGYWIFSLCLYRFASRRSGVLGGAIAMLFPMATSAYYYAYEARPHAIVFGFCGLAMVCWQMAEEPEARQLAAFAGFGAALFGALMMHCYALVLLGPFACAEIVRMAQTRRVRWGFWAALILPAVVALVVYVPLLRSYTHAQTTTTFRTVALAGWSQVGHFFGSLWAPCMAIVAAIFVILLFDFSDRRVTFATGVRDDLILAASFLLMPVFGVVLGKLTHGPFFHRYFYTAVGGMAVALGIGTAALRNGRMRAALAIAALLAVSILVNTGRLAAARLRGQGERLGEESAGFRLETTPGKPLAMHSLLTEDRSGLPIAVVNPFDYIYLAYYAPQLEQRLYSVAQSASDYTYFGFERLKQCCGVFAHEPVTAADFAREHERYLVYGDGGTPDQILTLADPGTCAEAIQFRDEHFLARVSRKRD